eukprot:m.276995 g.276995  ORF g.276995 m.276995 type:complete len:353 (+) comp19778_c0_seq5:144-1202(+)
MFSSLGGSGAILTFQIIGLFVLMLLSKIVESRAAMRGCQRNPLPPWLDRSLRICFLGVLLGPTALSFDFYYMRFPVATMLLLLYMPSYSNLCEQQGGWSNLYARRMFVFRWVWQYFSLRLVKTVDLDAKKSYIFGIHPHGILPFGAITAFNYELSADSFKNLFPGIELRTLAATFCFYIPGYREILLAGGVVDAARYSAKAIMNSGYSLSLVPGGATEALYNEPTKDVVYLRKRFGFVKLALETGASLVPVFSFNECDTYTVMGTDSPTINGFKRKFQAIFGISLPLVTNIIPKRAKIVVVVGKPIVCPKTDAPENAMVQEYLDKYIDALETLYNENKDKYNSRPKPNLTVI